MSEMNRGVQQFIDIIAGTSSFEPATNPDHRDLNGSPELQLLYQRVRYMNIDGWHFVDFHATREISELMRQNAELFPQGELVDSSVVDVGIKPLYWNDHWVPIFSIEHEFLCVDTDPAENGNNGQIIRVSVDDEERKVVATSLSDFLSKVVDAYSRGDLVLETDDNKIELRSKPGYEFFAW